MALSRELLYAHKPYNADIMGKYEEKYYYGDDAKYTGKDGQHLRFTYDDKLAANIVEIFPLAKPVSERYSDNFQKSYGKQILASRNIIVDFAVEYHRDIISTPSISGNSINLVISDYTVTYSESSEVKLQNAVLGNELVKVVSELIEVLSILNKDISTHVHPNAGQSLNWRSSNIQNKLNSIKEYLPSILSTVNYTN